MNLLICNIGTRDVQIPPALSALLFPGVEPYRLPERLRSQTLLAQYEAHASAIELPLIRKALRHVEDHTGALPQQVVLIASDQPAPPASADYHAKDTIDTARLVQRLLAERYNIHERRIRVAALRDEPSQHNPADYDGVMRAVKAVLQEVLAAHPAAERCYLEITGGTPAMTTALLLMGTQVFGKRAIPISVMATSEMVYSLETGRQLLQHTLGEVISADLDDYSYASAARTYAQQRDLLADHQTPGEQQLTAALLDYAHRRLNLDFDGCRRALSGHDTVAGGQYRTAVMQLYNEVIQLETHWLLHEILVGARITYGRGAYADFLGRVFRLHEGCLRVLVERLGGQFDPTRPGHFARAWLESLPPLGKLFTGAEGELQTSLSRPRLLHVASVLAAQQGDTAAQNALVILKQLDALATLRNQTQIAHGFAGLSRQVLADHLVLSEQQRTQGKHADTQQADAVLTMLDAVYTAVVGQPPGDNPFDAINTLLRRLLLLQR